MEARLPEEKFTQLQSTVTEWMGKKKATKQEILSLVGQLQHTAKVVRAGRTFVVTPIYSLASKLKVLHFKCVILTRLVLVTLLSQELEWLQLITLE